MIKVKVILHVPSPCPCPSQSPCANGDGLFNGQIRFRTHSVCQCKFDGDCDGDGHLFLYQTLRDFVNTRLLVHKHVKISVDEWILKILKQLF